MFWTLRQKKRKRDFPNEIFGGPTHNFHWNGIQSCSQDCFTKKSARVFQLLKKKIPTDLFFFVFDKPMWAELLTTQNKVVARSKKSLQDWIFFSENRFKTVFGKKTSLLVVPKTTKASKAVAWSFLGGEVDVSIFLFLV
jgi:hypothetical protein